MKLTIEIQEHKAAEFLKFIKGLDFVKIATEPEDVPQWQKDEVLKRVRETTEYISDDKSFIDKWSGVLKETSVDEKYAYLKEKHK